MHFDVVLYVFIHPCTKKRRRAQYSRRVDVAVCVRALQMCVCACASDVCVCVRFRCVCVCVCASDVCVCVCVCFRCVCVRALQMCVCACASDVCVCVRFRCVRGKLLTQRATVTTTIPSVFYTRLVSSGSPYIESWHVRLNENARVGGNAQTDIMWKCGPCQNKRWLFMLQISVFYTWHRCIVSSYIVSIYWSISMNRYTPIMMLIFICYCGRN